MALPLPNEARTGGGTAHRSLAQNLYDYYVAIAKLSKEIQGENFSINLYSLSELDRNAWLFINETAFIPFDEKVRHAIEDRFKKDGATWASHTLMEADFTSLKTACEALRTAVNQVPEMSDPAAGVLHYTRSQTGDLTENYRQINKPHSVETQISAVVNLFEAEGAP